MLDVELDHQPKVYQTKHLKFVKKTQPSIKAWQLKEAHQDVVCKMASVPPKPGETRSLSQLEAGVRRVGSFQKVIARKRMVPEMTGITVFMQEPCRVWLKEQGYFMNLLRDIESAPDKYLYIAHLESKMRKFADDPFFILFFVLWVWLGCRVATLGNGCSSRVWSAALSRVL